MAPHLLLCVVCWLCFRSADGLGTPLRGSVTGPDFLVTDGTRDLTLTCQVPDALVVDRYEWFTPRTVGMRCETTQAPNVCTFQPRLEDDNQNVTCAVLDPTGEPLLRTFYQVNLKYPPSYHPTITTEPPGTQSLKQGDVITCTVTGGKPRVTNVIFHCQHPDHADQEDDVSDNGTTVSSSITVNTSQASNQSLLCICSAHWDPEPGLYNETIYKEFILGFSEPPQADNGLLSLGVIGGVIGAVAVVVVAIVVVAVVMWKYRRRKRINSRQRATTDDNPQTTRQQLRQRRTQQISPQQTRGQEQPHDVAAAVQEGSHTTSPHIEIGNPYDGLQPGQDDERTYTELMTSSTADNDTYLHPVNDDYEIPA